MPDIMKSNNVPVSNNEKLTLPSSDGQHQKDELYKILFECVRDITVCRQLIYYIGTSNDNRKLRMKIQKLQEVVFKNIVSQKEAIIRYTKNSSSANKNDSHKLERLICFTLSTLSYIEDLVDKFNMLVTRFPLCGASEIVVNLGFEDSTINGMEDPTSENYDSNGFHSDSDAKSRLKYIQNLKDEIEQTDANLLRYNVNTDSQEFYKSISAYNQDMKHLSIDDEESKLRVFFRLRNCSKRKALCLCITLVLILLIIAAIVIAVKFSNK